MAARARRLRRKGVRKMIANDTIFNQIKADRDVDLKRKTFRKVLKRI